MELDAPAVPRFSIRNCALTVWFARAEAGAVIEAMTRSGRGVAISGKLISAELFSSAVWPALYSNMLLNVSAVTVNRRLPVASVSFGIVNENERLRAAPAAIDPSVSVG